MTDVADAVRLLAEAELETSYAKSGFHRAFRVHAARLPEVGGAFAHAGYFLEMLTCLDLRATGEGMRLVYTWNRFGPADRHRVEVLLAATRPWTGPAPKGKAKTATPPAPSEPLPTEAPSLTGLFPAADWLEREVFDMFGVTFTGHPNLKRLLLPEDATFHALLKDFGRMDDAPPAEGSHGGG